MRTETADFLAWEQELTRARWTDRVVTAVVVGALLALAIVNDRRAA